MLTLWHLSLPSGSNKRMARLDDALAAIDALHAEDPTLEQGEPAELVYARRMSAALARLVPDPSEALQLAVRAQHLQRWTLPRADYPDGKPGYHAWRNEQKRRHAALAAEALRGAGYDEAIITRVGELVQKRRLAKDPEAQALEDAACLVFLENQLLDFAEGRDERGLVTILQKTWAKMSEAGRREALALELPPAAQALVSRALGSG